ncbi:hypothetical protein YN1551_1492 [Sulfolobus islandicus Y.N.15.51]|uniref:Uncharacterized protein n=1 Tax=Saccharolobus islandicus (strain Y.N.15.51 / Yellowstone \|nr:hypothetical protein YN1551_1492 [Sulfolobus islandicus Y.N.15.51]
MIFFNRKRDNIDVVENDENIIKLETTNGVIKAKKILSINGKHVIYQDQYGNVKEALLK